MMVKYVKSINHWLNPFLNAELQREMEFREK